MHEVHKNKSFGILIITLVIVLVFSGLIIYNSNFAGKAIQISDQLSVGQIAFIELDGSMDINSQVSSEIYVNVGQEVRLVKFEISYVDDFISLNENSFVSEIGDVVVNLDDTSGSMNVMLLLYPDESIIDGQEKIGSLTFSSLGDEGNGLIEIKNVEALNVQNQNVLDGASDELLFTVVVPAPEVVVEPVVDEPVVEEPVVDDTSEPVQEPEVIPVVEPDVVNLDDVEREVHFIEEEFMIDSCGFNNWQAGKRYVVNPDVFDAGLVSSGGNCFEINVDNVELDCFGTKITGSDDGYGVSISSANVAVKNCVVDGFGVGIYLGGDSSRAFIDNNEIKNSRSGIYFELESMNHIVKNNLFETNSKAINFLGGVGSVLENNNLIGGGLFTSFDSRLSFARNNVVRDVIGNFLVNGEPFVVGDEQGLNGLRWNGDIDDDGLLNHEDNCPFVSNVDQANLDNDAWGDLCDDSYSLVPNQACEGFDGCQELGVNSCMGQNGLIKCQIYGDCLKQNNVICGVESICVESKGSSQCVVGQDQDGDGFLSNVDCNDQNNLINSGAVESCDGIDNNCDDIVDNGVDMCGAGMLCIEGGCLADQDKLDNDGDNILNGVDNCIGIANVNQADLDSDGVGDECDSDQDGDGIDFPGDNCALIVNPNQEDNDGDGQGDICDADDDNDGSLDGADCLPFDSDVKPGAYDLCDGKDNNCDGNVDNGVDMCSEGFECRGAIGCQVIEVEEVFGDANGDGVVGFVDLNLFIASYDSNQNDDNYNDLFDFNSDGNIGFFDLNGFIAAYNG
jgi:parallel beta-helix repeat protein